MWVNEIIGWQDVKLEKHQIIIIHTFVIHILSTAEVCSNIINISYNVPQTQKLQSN